MKIVYFSKYNNTRCAAELMQKKYGGELLELKEKRKGNFIQAIMKKGSKLKDKPWHKIKSDEKLYLMCPIWASNGVPAMNAFLDDANLTGKDIVIITFQQFEDFKNADKVHEHLEDFVISRGGTVTSKHKCIGGKIGKFAGETFISEQLKQCGVM